MQYNSERLFERSLPRLRYSLHAWMGGYLSHFVTSDRTMSARVDTIGEDRREFMHFMLEHICLCVIKEHLDRKGQGETLNSFPLLRGE